MREYRFDVVRVVCMTYIVTYIHLYEYIYPNGRMTFYLPICIGMTHACLGAFTFVSGYLLGKKYIFGQQGDADIWTFYKKRILRIVPLFIVSSILLWLIDFNGSKSTLNGLLCVSPFIDPKPRTLYYIPIILWCYLITPLISRHRLKWRIMGSLVIMVIIAIARYLFPSIDSRFLFNVFFYLVGVISAPCFNWRFNIPHGTSIKISAVLTFVIIVTIVMYYSMQFSNAVQMAIGAMGVFVILFVCEGISSLLFDNSNVQQSVLKKRVCQLISVVSYASMTCYMFHRFFYWSAESIWNPSDTSVKWFYMIVIVFPIILVCSYAIQKVYDNLHQQT